MNKYARFCIPLALLVLSAASVGAVPWFGASQGNPYTATDGGVWGAYDASNGITNWANYDLLDWYAGEGFWVQQTPESRPGAIFGYESGPMLISAYTEGAEPNSIAALVFTAPVNGNYWVHGELYASNVEAWGGDELVPIVVGKFNSANEWTSLISRTIPNTSYWNTGLIDFDNYPAVTNFPMSQGDKLVFTTYATNYYNAMALYFNGNSWDPVTISWYATGNVISGNLILADLATPSDMAGQTVNIDLQVDGVTVRSTTATLGSEGEFSISDVDPGTYGIRIKTSHWLAKVIPAVAVSGPVNIGSITLTNGDCDGDNEVTSTDLSLLGLALGATPSDSNWYADADLDGDSEVTSTDLSILGLALGVTGD